MVVFLQCSWQMKREQTDRRTNEKGFYLISVTEINNTLPHFHVKIYEQRWLQTLFTWKKKSLCRSSVLDSRTLDKLKLIMKYLTQHATKRIKWSVSVLVERWRNLKSNSTASFWELMTAKRQFLNPAGRREFSGYIMKSARIKESEMLRFKIALLFHTTLRADKPLKGLFACQLWTNLSWTN